LESGFRSRALPGIIQRSVEKNRVIRSAFKVGSFTSLSRVLGLVRDTLTASLFGTSAVMSDFVVAFRLPNLFRALFGEGALSSAFVPVFMATRREEGDASAWLVARKTVTLVAAFLSVLVLLLILGTFALERLNPDLAERAPHLLPLMRVMLPYVVFICLAGLFMAMLNACHQFSLPAFTPSLLNMVWIGFVLLVCPRLGDTPEQQIYGIAAAVFVAGLVQMGVQVPALMRRGFRPGFTWDTSDARVRRVFTLMGPTALGQSVTQVNVMVNTLLARWAAEWAPASLFYAERLLYFPQGLLATAMSTVLLPVFSGHAARGDHAEMRQTLGHSLRTLLFVMIPASIGLLVLAEPIVQMIFGWGRFDAAAVSHTAVALQFYAPGLMVFCLAKVFVPAFYALQDTRTPFRIGLRAVALNFALNVAFVLTWPHDLKHAGLAFATVLSEGVNGITLGVLLQRRLGALEWSPVFAAATRALACSAVMAVILLAVRPALAAGLAQSGAPAKLVEVGSVLLAIATGIAAYFGAALALRAPELGFARDALRRRVAK
jgi:putative peptidoglycan lipid II flippase